MKQRCEELQLAIQDFVKFFLLLLLGLAVIPLGILAVSPPVDRQRDSDSENRDGGEYLAGPGPTWAKGA